MSFAAPTHTTPASSHAAAGIAPDSANGPSACFCTEIGTVPGQRIPDVGCEDGGSSRFVTGLAEPDGEIVLIDRCMAAITGGRTAARCGSCLVEQWPDMIGREIAA